MERLPTALQAESLARGDSDGFVLEVDGPLLPENMRALVSLLSAQQVSQPLSLVPCFLSSPSTPTHPSSPHRIPPPPPSTLSLAAGVAISASLSRTSTLLRPLARSLLSSPPYTQPPTTLVAGLSLPPSLALAFCSPPAATLSLFQPRSIPNQLSP